LQSAARQPFIQPNLNLAISRFIGDRLFTRPLNWLWESP
jgi:hypothetical protein